MSTAPEGSRTGPETVGEPVPPRPAALPMPVANGSAPAHEPAPVAGESAATSTEKPVAPVVGPKPGKKKPGAKSPSVPPQPVNERADEGAAAMAIAPRGGAGAARALRKKRARALALGLAVWVGIPVVLSLIYYGFIAQPVYESVTQLAVRGQDVPARVAMVREHIVSRDMLGKVETAAQVSSEYRSSTDPWTRYVSSAGSEGAYQAFRHHVTADADAVTGMVTLRVRATSGEQAQRIAQVIADESQSFLVSMSAGGSRDPLTTAKAHLADVEARLVALEQAASTTDARVLAVRRDVLQRELESALRGVEGALHNPGLADALVVVAKPSLPSDAAYPRRVYGVITVLFISLLLFGIASLMIAAVREHAQF